MKYTLIQRMQKTNDVLVKYDPIGLISAGAPIDEYESEAVMIVQNLVSDWRIDSLSIKDIIFWCQDVFEDQFSPGIAGNVNWEPIAKEILEICQ